MSTLPGLPAPCRPRTPALLLALATLLGGCSFFAPTVTVERVGPDDIYEELSSFVLNSGELSVGTLDVLHSADLSEVLEDDEREALLRLHSEIVARPTRAKLFAAAELSHYLGREDDDQDAYLASAVYAWHYLLNEDLEEPPNPYDRRFRQACDLYNGSLMRAVLDPESEGIRLTQGRRALPVGSIDLAVDRAGFPWSEADYPELLPADEFHLDGLTLRLREAGLGVPLIAVPDPARAQLAVAAPGAPLLDLVTGVDDAGVPRSGLTKTPANLFLRVESDIADARTGMRGTLELHQTFDDRAVTVGDREVPLESDISIVLGYSLHRSPLWKFSLRGLLNGDVAVEENRLLFATTPRRGRIPVVFVHGTASNPALWGEMFNVLLNDGELRKHAQCWFFQYASGNPVLYSAMTLREQLYQIVQELDPEGTDPAIQHMVIVAHSQGGLVSRLMALDGDIGWLEDMIGKSSEEAGFNEQQQALLDKAFEFEPLPFLDRVVYISTPHRGSFLASKWISRWMAKFIALPGAVTNTLGSLFEEGSEMPSEFSERIPTSLDNMRPGHPLLSRMVQEPTAEHISEHSIIAIGDADPLDPEALLEADDGVVEYTSAHIEPVESELFVNASHSCQTLPASIAEVRRIMHLQVDEVEALRQASGP